MLFGPLLLFVALVVGRFALDGGMWFCSYHTRSPMLMRIKEEVFGYAQRLSPAYFESTLSGKIAHRTVLLPDQVLLLFDMMVFDFIPSGMFFVFVAALFYLANPMFCAAAAVSIVVYFVTSLCLGRECAKRSAANNEARAAVTGRIVDVITNIRNVFLFANQPLEDRELGRYTGEERDRRMALYRSVVRLRCVQYVMDILMWLAFVGGALYAWVHRIIGAGDFVMITALTGSLLQTAYNLGQRIPEFYEQLGAAQESIGTLIVPATIQDRPSASTLVVKQGAIHFERVAFAYDAGKRGPRNVVQDFELFIPPGQRLGLVGPSGAGKTTLMGLLMRMHDVTAGAILRDAPILLLDEATSALDSHSEHLIQQAMRAAMVGKSVIAIAHRLSTVMDMDRLIVLQRGVIVADGSHSELLRRGGLYAELWRRQSGGFNPVAAREAEELEEEFPAEGAGGGDLVVERQHALAGHEDRS